MITKRHARIEANRQNARKSTGPRTPEGKARSSRNAIRHGFCSNVAFMDDENNMREDFALLLADLRAEHQPDGPTEDILVFKMAEAFFAFNRAGVLLAERLDYNDAEDDSREVALMLRYYTTADRAFNRNLHDLRKLQKERELEEVGFVSQDDQPEPETEPEAEPEKPSAQPAAPGIRPVIVIETPKTPDSTLESSPQPAPKAA